VVYPWNWQGEAFCSIVGAFSGSSDGSNITNVSAVLSQRTSQTTSNDDSAATNYQNTVGTSSLGPIISTTVSGCLMGNETVATLTPSTYSGTVKFSRIVLMENNYVNSAPDGAQILNQLDGPSDSNMDESPQSGGSAGKVYAVGAPGKAVYVVDSNSYSARSVAFGAIQHRSATTDRKRRTPHGPAGTTAL
jgi:hypothetical protein